MCVLLTNSRLSYGVKSICFQKIIANPPFIYFVEILSGMTINRTSGAQTSQHFIKRVRYQKWLGIVAYFSNTYIIYIYTHISSIRYYPNH